MVTFYAILKFVHVLLAIVAVGANATYGVWAARAKREPEHMAYALGTLKFLDDRIANPAYILLLITGGALVEMGDWSWSAPWLSAALGLYVLLAALALGVYTPTLRKQIAEVEAGRLEGERFVQLSRRATQVGLVLAALAVAIVFFMTVKPG